MEQLMKEDEAGTSHHPAQSLRGKKKKLTTLSLSWLLKWYP